MSRHVLPQGGLGIVEVGDVDPIRVRRHDLARLVVGIPVRVFADQHRIPRRVIRHDVDEHLHAALVRGGHQAFQVVGAAVGRIDRIVVAHRVRTADGALGLELAQWMDGHEPDDRDPEILQPVELRGDAREIAFFREGARENFVDHGIAEPVGSGTCRRVRHRGRRNQSQDERHAARAHVMQVQTHPVSLIVPERGRNIAAPSRRPD